MIDKREATWQSFTDTVKSGNAGINFLRIERSDPAGPSFPTGVTMLPGFNDNYQPQAVELFDGSVTEILVFDGELKIGLCGAVLSRRPARQLRHAGGSGGPDRETSPQVH
jgi:hypothetical protein